MSETTYNPRGIPEHERSHTERGIPPTYTEGSPYNMVPTWMESDVRSEFLRGGGPRNPVEANRRAADPFGAFRAHAASQARSAEHREKMQRQASSINNAHGPTGMGEYRDYIAAMRSGDPAEATKIARGMAKTGGLWGGIGGGAASGGFGGGGNFGGVNRGLPLYTDPMSSPTRIGVPTWQRGMSPEEIRELLVWARALSAYYYRSDHLIATCMNLYAKYPFAGMSLHCPDPSIEDEYNVQFFDILNYEELMPLANLQYWSSGEAPMLGTWSDSAKMWVDEQILDPDYIDVISWPGPHDSRESFFWLPPDSLVELLRQADPDDPRYRDLLENYESDIEDWALGNPNELPSEEFSLLRHDVRPNENRGFPILMRAFDKLMQEEELNQSVTSVAKRLSTPFIVAKLGGQIIPGADGTTEAYFPTQADIDAMQQMIEVTLASKHRTMVWHSGITFENPFEGMNVPNLNEDFDRLSREKAAVFGISLDLIYGGQSGTYAAGALAAETMMQNLQASQRTWTRWIIQDRAKRVAEERGYYTVERKGKVLTKPMERIPVYDPESDSWRMETRRKLALPSIRLETIDWRDQQAQFGNMMQLKSQGVFIPDSYLMAQVDPDVDVGAMHETFMAEAEEKAEMTRLLSEQGAGGEAGDTERGVPAGGSGIPGGGAPGGAGGRPGTPGGGGAPRPGGAGGGAPGAGQTNPPGDLPGPGNAPPQSSEQRADMPAPQDSPRAAASLNRRIKRESSYRYLETSKEASMPNGGTPEDETVEEYVQVGKDEESEREVIAKADRDFGPGHTVDDSVTNARRGVRREEVEPPKSYAERVRGFETFTSRGAGAKKTGTLFSLEGRRLKSRPTK